MQPRLPSGARYPLRSPPLVENPAGIQYKSSMRLSWYRSATPHIPTLLLPAPRAVLTMAAAATVLRVPKESEKVVWIKGCKCTDNSCSVHCCFSRCRGGLEGLFMHPDGAARPDKEEEEEEDKGRRGPGASGASAREQRAWRVALNAERRGGVLGDCCSPGSHREWGSGGRSRIAVSARTKLCMIGIFRQNSNKPQT